MDPPEQPMSPAAKLSTLDLNSTPIKRQRDTTTENSSPTSVFDDSPFGDTHSLSGSPIPGNESSLFGGNAPAGTRKVLWRRRYAAAGGSLLAPPSKRKKFNDYGIPTVIGVPMPMPMPMPVRQPTDLPSELWDMILDYVYDDFDDKEYHLLIPKDVHTDIGIQASLGMLRLVSKSWNDRIAPRIFHTLSAAIGRESNPLVPIFKAAESPWAKDVRDLRFGIVGPWYEEYERYTTNLSNGALSVLLKDFNNIHTLRLHSPTVIAPIGDNPQISTYCLADLTNSLVHSLRFVTLPALRCLHLSLPVTAEFTRFFKVDSYARNLHEILGNLDELHVTLNDNSGKDAHRDHHYARSAVRNRYPLQPWAPDFIKFISLAQNVKVLSIEARVPVDLSALKLPNLTKVKSLKLFGFEIEWKPLWDILRTGRWTLRRLEIRWVQLMDGSWDNIFDLDNLRNLDFVNVRCATYSKRGTSAHLRGSARSDIGTDTSTDPSGLLTEHQPDWEALYKVQTRSKANRQFKGLRPCSRLYLGRYDPA